VKSETEIREAIRGLDQAVTDLDAFPTPAKRARAAIELHAWAQELNDEIKEDQTVYSSVRDEFKTAVQRLLSVGFGIDNPKEKQ
jgi:hypothetical protein